MLRRSVTVPAINTALQPRQINSDNPPTTLVNLCDTFAGAPDWNNTGSGGTSAGLVTDPDDTPMGNAFIRCTSNTTPSNQCATRKTNFALNMTGRFWEIWVRISDISQVANCQIQATNDGFVNFSTWSIDLDLFKSNNVWYKVRMNWSDRVDTGIGVPRALFSTIQLKCTNSAGITLAYTVDWGGINSIQERTQAIISVVFDDSYASAYNRARRKMDQYAFKGTTYNIPDRIGESGRLTEDQLNKLQRSGWDIGSHGSIALTDLTISEAENEIRTVKKWFTDRGYVQCDHYAYPNGAFNYEIEEQIIKKYFQSARSIIESPETLPPADPYALRIRNVTDSDSVASVTAQIDTAIANFEWLILVFHNIADVVTVPATEYSTANFELIMDHLNTAVANVMPISEAFKLMRTQTD